MSVLSEPQIYLLTYHKRKLIIKVNLPYKVINFCTCTGSPIPKIYFCDVRHGVLHIL